MDNKFEILNEILDLFLTEYHYIPQYPVKLHVLYIKMKCLIISIISAIGLYI